MGCSILSRRARRISLRSGMTPGPPLSWPVPPRAPLAQQRPRPQALCPARPGTVARAVIALNPQPLARITCADCRRSIVSNGCPRGQHPGDPRNRGCRRQHGHQSHPHAESSHRILPNPSQARGSQPTRCTPRSPELFHAARQMLMGQRWPLLPRQKSCTVHNANEGRSPPKKGSCP